PATGDGKISAKMAKGVFRFVTGRVARRDPGSMKVNTPVGTIGIRGTMVAGKVSADEGSIVLIGPGPGNNADENPGGISVGNHKGPNGPGSLNLTLDVDFGNRTLGGGSSGIVATGLTGASITQFSFASLTGAADQFNLLPHMSFTPGQFTSGTLTLKNKDGIAAETAVFTGTFNSGGSDNSGTVSANR